MTTTDSIQVTLHDSQADIITMNPNTLYAVWQRGGGKTGGGIGPRFLHLSEVMPRSQVLLFSDTYDRLQKRIVPNITGFLTSKLGLIEGLDFVKYKKPPAHFAKPLIPLDLFEHVISFASGMALCLVSLHVEGSANAYNAQAAIGDEVKYCDEEQINTEVLPALRGSEDIFGHLPEYLSVWMFTDKWGPKVKWILAKKKEVKQRDVLVVRTLQKEIYRLQQLEREAKSTKTVYECRRKILEYKTKADKIRKHMVYFSDMKPYENLGTLGKFFFKRARKICKSLLQFNVAFLNHDPDRVEHGFYPDISEENYYENNSDIDLDKPLIISMDYNHRIVPVVIGQVGKLPSELYETLNTVGAIHALSPGGITEAIIAFDEFCIAKGHRKRMVHYVYDATAIGKDPGRDAYNVMVTKALKKLGWIVMPVYIRGASDQGVRYLKLKELLSKTGQMAVKINRSTTEYLQLSLNQAGAKTKGSLTVKDKDSERDYNFPAEESTHYSEAFDHLLWAVLVLKLVKKPGGLGGSIRTS
jgi:hypothetical protein